MQHVQLACDISDAAQRAGPPANICRATGSTICLLDKAKQACHTCGLVCTWLDTQSWSSYKSNLEVFLNQGPSLAFCKAAMQQVGPLARRSLHTARQTEWACQRLLDVCRVCKRNPQCVHWLSGLTQA